ncbi:hypothetical protein ACWFRM_35705 [Streptomyces sp. NPDC055144]
MTPSTTTGPIHIGSHELVLIDRPAATLTLLVAVDDQSVACGGRTGRTHKGG